MALTTSGACVVVAGVAICMVALPSLVLYSPIQWLIRKHREKKSHRLLHRKEILQQGFHIHLLSAVEGSDDRANIKNDFPRLFPSGRWRKGDLDTLQYIVYMNISGQSSLLYLTDDHSKNIADLPRVRHIIMVPSISSLPSVSSFASLAHSMGVNDDGATHESILVVFNSEFKRTKALEIKHYLSLLPRYIRQAIHVTKVKAFSRGITHECINDVVLHALDTYMNLS